MNSVFEYVLLETENIVVSISSKTLYLQMYTFKTFVLSLYYDALYQKKSDQVPRTDSNRIIVIHYGKFAVINDDCVH